MGLIAWFKAFVCFFRKRNYFGETPQRWILWDLGTMFLRNMFTQKMPDSSDSIYSSIFIQENIWYQKKRKETLPQVFSCEFCEISKNIFFYRKPQTTAFVISEKQCPRVVLLEGCSNNSSRKTLFLEITFWYRCH